MSTFLQPDAVEVSMTQLTTESQEIDKALVYDETKGHYVLMSADVAKVQILKSKPIERRVLMVRLLASLLLVGGLVAGGLFAWKWGDSRRNAEPITPVAVTTVTTPVAAAQPPAVPANSSGDPALPFAHAQSAQEAFSAVTPSIQVAVAASAPAAVASAPALVALQAQVAPSAAGLPMVKASAAVAPTVVAQAPAPKASAIAVATVKPAPAPVVAKVAPKPPVAVATATTTKTTGSKAPAQAESVPQTMPISLGWALEVNASGVFYFDGIRSKLFRVGDTLPNGEKIIDVDEGLATYATDRGVRQIRSVQMKGK